MISEIYIKNIAVIEETRVSFDRGLNILSGETGAGKSILIDSINFVLGQRSSRDIIRRGADEAFVSALIYIENEKNIEAIRNTGVELDEGGELLLTRSLGTNGRNVCRINGRPASMSLLKDIAAFLIDIYGQHQNLSLLDKNRHMELLDGFCGEELKQALDENAKKYALYREEMRELKALDGSFKDRDSALEILEFRINEIKGANLKIGEEKALKEERDILYNAERIRELSMGAANLLYRGEGSAVEKTGEALNMLISLERLDPSVGECIRELSEISDRLGAVTESIRDIADRTEGGGQKLAQAENRLDVIKLVTSKYGGSEEEALKFLKEAEERYAEISEGEERAARLKESIKAQKREILKSCIKISEIRRKYADFIEKETEKNLRTLGMENAVFKINISRRKTFDKLGMDDVEFFISTNPGEEPKPLAKIASGGEISRVMLSIKSVLSETDDMETFIFDEIDTGISGRTAQKVAEKLSALGEKRQILCITHLSQICAAGDANFCIEKTSDADSARTTVTRLDEESIINEIARLNGGAEITSLTLDAARELRRGSRAKKEM